MTRCDVLNRLFVLEDDPGICTAVRSIAEGLGADVFTFRDIGTFKTAYAAGDEPGWILLDLNLGDGNGIDVLRFLAAQKCSARILLMSGADLRVIQAAERIGRGYGLVVAGRLQKPFSLGQLKAALAGIDGPRAERRPEHSLVEDLQRALVGGELRLHYQPIVTADAGRIVGAEALSRWPHPTRGMIPPATFIPAAEAGGLLRPLTDWVVEEGLRQLAAWHAQGLAISLSVNVPAEALSDLDFPGRLDAQLRGAGVPAEWLTLEITESDIMRDMLTTTDVLTRLRLAGVKLSIDDFGTGHSSLVRLHRLPFNELKIDRSFVANLVHDGESQLLVSTMVGLAHKLGMRTVAEGIEDEETLACLRQFGCDEFQGFLIARPMPPEVLMSLPLCQAAVSRSSTG